LPQSTSTNVPGAIALAYDDETLAPKNERDNIEKDELAALKFGCQLLAA